MHIPFIYSFDYVMRNFSNVFYVYIQGILHNWDKLYS